MSIYNITGLIALGCAIVTGSPALAQDAPNRDSTTESLQRLIYDYAEAASRGDGEVAAALLDSNTVNYYSGLARAALFEEEAELRRRPAIDKLIVLRFRVSMDPQRLDTVTGRAIVQEAIERGWIGTPTAPEIDAADMRIEGDSAWIDLGPIQDVPPPILMFRRESGTWKWDMTALFDFASAQFVQGIDALDMTEDELVISTLELVVEEEVTEEIWQPLRP